MKKLRKKMSKCQNLVNLFFSLSNTFIRPRSVAESIFLPRGEWLQVKIAGSLSVTQVNDFLQVELKCLNIFLYFFWLFFFQCFSKCFPGSPGTPIAPELQKCHNFQYCYSLFSLLLMCLFEQNFAIQGKSAKPFSYFNLKRHW